MQTESLRIDKWLWHARFYKTRSLAQQAACSGVLRLNNARVEKPSVTVKTGDVLTVPRGRREVAVIRVQALGVRRGPATEAQSLYEVLVEGDPSTDRPTYEPLRKIRNGEMR